MKLVRWLQAMTLCAVLAALSIPFALAQESSPETASDQAASESRVTLDVARDRAKLLHRVYHSTLEVLHDRYFTDDRAIVPARAMEDIFTEISEQSNVKANWIAVNTEPMSVHHTPKTDFEKKAVEAIAAGKPDFELVEANYYQRAVAIPLGAGCISCHTGFFAKPSKTPRFAALVIGMEIEGE